MPLKKSCEHWFNGKTTAIIAHTFPNGTTRRMCSICMKTWNPGDAPDWPKEEPVTINTSTGMPNVLRAYIKKKSAGNIIIHELLSAMDPTQNYALRCKVCNTQYCWSPNPTYPFGLDINFVDNFCTGHADCQFRPKGPATILPFKVEEELLELPEVPTGRKFR